jgi:hypothetical protein
MIRLCNNNFTKELIENIVEYYYQKGYFHKDSLLNYVIQILNLEHFDEQILAKLANFLKTFKQKQEENKTLEEVTKIKDILKPNYSPEGDSN